MNASTSAIAPAMHAAGGADPAREWHAMARSAIRCGLAAIAIAAGTLIAWLVLAPLSGSVIAMGAVKVDTNRKTVQHRDGGIVRTIFVREGEHVTAGQPLVELDDSRIDAALNQTSSQLDAMRVRQSRLAAEREFKASWTAPEALRRPSDPRLAETVAREEGLFTVRRSALDSQIRQLGQQADEAAREIAARQRESASVRLALQHMQEEVAANEALLKDNFINKTRVLALKRSVAEYQIKEGDNAAELSQARRTASELALRISALRDGYAQEASTELRDVNSKIIDLEEQLGAARDASARKLITAPVAGRVVDLRVTTAGGALGPRDPVLDIVPDDAPLLVEAHVPVDAIADLRIGLPADVRLTPYKQRETPLINARVVYVSADSLVDRHSGIPYFAVHVELDRDSLAKAGNLVASPGMGAEVFVRTRDRTTLDFLLEPLVNAMRRSLREH
ncbi:MAG TPA: HlyD family type I secretion periplasmic adaptor subunit [Rubrivivax sp.]|nr:HlyD family type I secretion periplasmic adaptor subunit [Rubrivivax sp.]